MFNIFKIRRKVDEKKSAMEKQIEKLVKKKKERERLKLIHYIKTDYAEYFVYNTQTLQGVDCVNIEIERLDPYGKKELILQKEIFEDSFGGMCGDSFHSLVIDALWRLNEYIKEKREFIIEDKIIN
jgi:hypothetical protein